MLLSVEVGSMINSDEKEHKREAKTQVQKVRGEVGSMITSDSFEHIQGASLYNTPLSAEARGLMTPDSFECSNERKEERSEGSSARSTLLSVELDSMIGSDYLHQSHRANKLQCDDM